jgi:decaprenyl-phosphate phosphoribosyltransferase
MLILGNILRLIRVGHWIKNGFLFVPLFFAGEIVNTDKVILVTWGFLGFCFAASAVYVLNDLMDLAADRLHPEKSKRPLASGEVNTTAGWSLLALLALAASFIAYVVHQIDFSWLLGSYFLLNVFYSLGLKKIPILEMLMVSSGFVIRTVAGGFLAGVEVSQWMMMMIFLLALFLSIAKRRDDVLLSGNKGLSIRKVIESYTLEYINALLVMVSGVIIVAYLMYVISPEVISRFHSKYLYVTSIFVIAGIMRYLQITLVENKAGSPTKVLYQDNFIRWSVFLWIVTFYFIIY